MEYFTPLDDSSVRGSLLDESATPLDDNSSALEDSTTLDDDACALDDSIAAPLLLLLLASDVLDSAAVPAEMSVDPAFAELDTAAALDDSTELDDWSPVDDE